MKTKLMILLAILMLTVSGCGNAAQQAESAAEVASAAEESALKEESVAEEIASEVENATEEETPAVEPTPAEEEMSENESVAEESGEAASMTYDIVFATTDMDGNPVDSAELFASHKFTMMNIWTSWCPPCIAELPELQRLSEEWAANDCAVIGFLADGDDEAGRAEAAELLANAGADYLNILPWENWIQLLPIDAFPTTIFVNSKGEMVGQIVVGANPEGYESVMADLLQNDA